MPIKDFIHHYPRALFNDIPRVGAHFYDIPGSGRTLTTYPGQGRPRKTWLEIVEADMAELEIDKDVHDRSK